MFIRPVKVSVTSPDQPNQIPPLSRKAELIATASPPWLALPLRALGALTRFDMMIRRLTVPHSTGATAGRRS